MMGKVKYKKRRKLTLDIVKNIAASYENLKEFRKNDGSAYSYAIRNNVFKDINLEKNVRQTPKEKTEELNQLRLTALKYKSKQDFKEKEYSKFRRMGKLRKTEEFCKHMIPIRTSRPQKVLHCLLDKILLKPSLYNTRKILNTYELDIYYPDYKLAFEFDGYFWHKNTQEKDAKKNIACIKKGIKLFRIVEPKREYKSLSHTVEDIKNQLLNIISDLREFVTVTEDFIRNISVDENYIAAEIYDIDDIKTNISTSTSYKDFISKWKHQYEFLRKNNLLHLLNGFYKRRNVISYEHFSNQEIIQYVKFKCSAYTDLFKNKPLYGECRKRCITLELHKILDTECQWRFRLNDVDFFASVCSFYPNYISFSKSIDCPRAKQRRLFHKIKKFFKTKV